jgi:F-type H+-transporting ATPase subunit b
VPQLEFIDFPSQIFWLLVTFTFLYYVLASYTLPTISDTLQDRQQRISDDLDKAKRLKTQAEEAETDFTSALSSAKEQALHVITQARTTIADEEALQFAKLDKIFEKQSQEADHRIRTSLETINTHLLPITVEASGLMVKTFTGKTVKAEAIEKVAQKFLDESRAEA